jgi:hypothetical protein
MNASWQVWKLTDASGFSSFVGHETDPFAAIATGYDAFSRITLAQDSAGRQYAYSYGLVGTNKRLMSVTAYAPGAGTTGPIAARVDYEYYAGSSTLGTVGDLKLATVTTPAGSGNLSETTAYRYWTSTSPTSIDGFTRGPARSVRLAVGPEGRILQHKLDRHRNDRRFHHPASRPPIGLRLERPGDAVDPRRIDGSARHDHLRNKRERRHIGGVRHRVAGTHNHHRLLRRRFARGVGALPLLDHLLR